MHGPVFKGLDLNQSLLPILDFAGVGFFVVFGCVNRNVAPARRRGAHACSNGAKASQLHTARAIGAVTMMAQDTINIVAVADLAPTQMTVGMREVSFKRRRWRERSSRQASRLPKHTTHSGRSGPKCTAILD